MTLDPATRTRLLADVELDTDPTGSTVEVKVDDTWYPATWLATPTQRRSRTRNGIAVTKWVQTARTNGYFCGPDATPAGAVVLALGDHPTKTRVTSGGDVLVCDADTITIA